MMYLSEEKSYIKQAVLVSDQTSDFVKTQHTQKDYTEDVVVVSIPEPYMCATIIGNVEAQYLSPDTYQLKAMDSLYNEPSDLTKIEVLLLDRETSYFMSCLPIPHYITYYDLRNSFSFKTNIIINKNSSLIFRIIKPDINIIKTVFKGTLTLWKPDEKTK